MAAGAILWLAAVGLALVQCREHADRSEYAAHHIAIHTENDMPQITTAQGVLIHYEDEYFGEPWLRDSAEVVVLVHGIAESSRSFYSWITPLAETYRVIRPDLPGFGQSRVPSELDYDWGPAGLSADLRHLVEALGIKKFHLVGAKYGGSVVIEYAARNPEQIKTLTVIGGPVQVVNQKSQVDVKGFSARIAAGGMLKWAEDSMDMRLGSKVSAAQRRWWVDMMAAADARATCASTDAVARMDLLESLKQISAPVLMITTKGNKLLPLANFEGWTAAARDAKLVALDGDAYHPAALHPAECIAAVKAHIRAARSSQG